MKTTILSRILALGIIMLTSLPIMAQEKIDKLVNQLEKKAGVTVTYTENRNPKTKKIVKQNTILSGNNSKDAEALWLAFEGERENSVKIVKSRNESFVIKFEDKNYHSSYVLSVRGGNWSLVISKQSPGFESDDSFSASFDFSCFDFSDLDLERLKSLEAHNDLNLECLKSLETQNGLNLECLKSLETHNDLNLECLKSLETQNGLNLERLKSLETLNTLNNLELSGDVLTYDKDGNVIYQSPASNKRNNSDGQRSKKSRSKSTSMSQSYNGSSVRTVTTNVSDCSGSSEYTYIYSN